MIFLGKVPSLDSSVRLTHPNHVRISKGKALYDEEDTLDEEDDLDETDDSSDECIAVFVYHSLSNDKLNHMVGESKNKVCFCVLCIVINDIKSKQQTLS